MNKEIKTNNANCKFPNVKIQTWWSLQDQDIQELTITIKSNSAMDDSKL